MLDRGAPKDATGLSLCQAQIGYGDETAFDLLGPSEKCMGPALSLLQSENATPWRRAPKGWMVWQVDEASRLRKLASGGVQRVISNQPVAMEAARLEMLRGCMDVEGQRKLEEHQVGHLDV